MIKVMFIIDYSKAPKNEVEISRIGICTVIEKIYGKDCWGETLHKISYDDQCDAVEKYAKERNLYLYERPNEVYYEWEGIEEATKGGYSGVIFSNLS
jgi:hypothetical protein